MVQSRVATGLLLPTYPPLGDVRLLVSMARAFRLDSVCVYDHFQSLIPASVWESVWWSTRTASPHAIYEYQTLLGGMAARAGRMQLGVAVTEPIRRHPVLIAQAAMTLAHLTKCPPILGLGSGERENTLPYGLDNTHAVDRLTEAVRIIRRCFSSTGPIKFEGKHFRLDGAVMDLQPPAGRAPQLWIAAHGPRMLELTGRYADGWLPVLTMISPEEYAAKLGQVRAAAANAGRDPDTITPALFAYLAVAANERTVRAMLDSRLLRYFGLLASADLWRKAGAEHPFGPDFRAIDILPEQYERAALDEALAVVPPEVTRDAVLVGTVDQVISQLRALGDAGLRHVLLGPISAFLSPRDWLYAGWAMRRIARSLRTPLSTTGPIHGHGLSRATQVMPQ
jgi:phthiodiolone/phenolphthiodiolone dimycocerosates ketoreductase